MLAAGFSILCILASVSCGGGAASSTYVGVRGGDSFEYSYTITAGGEQNFRYTFDYTYTINNLTEHTGYTAIGTHIYIRNATFNATSYRMETVKESVFVINQSTVGYLINKNIFNKSYNYHPDADFWVNGTWDDNGVFLRVSSLNIFHDGDYMLTEITRKDNVLPAVIVLIVIGVGLLGVFGYYKKTQDRNIFRELGTKVQVAVQRLRTPVQGTPCDWLCPACRAPIPRGSTYCLYCGEKVDDTLKAIPRIENHTLPPQAAGPESPPAGNEGLQPIPVTQPALGGSIPKEVMETLTFIAFQQPIVLLLIASRRGSAALEHVEFLVQRGLVQRQGSGPTAPVVTTEYFADMFGLSRDVKKMKAELKMDLES